MIKNVYELLSEIYKGNFDELPQKIKVNNEVYIKNDTRKDYMTIIKNCLDLPVEEVREGKLKPRTTERYYCVDTVGEICCDQWANYETDDYRYYTNNCFKTREEAERHLENIKTEIELRKFANELNNGEKIDWKNNEQYKYYLYYNHQYKTIDFSWELIAEQSHEIYCLDENFKDKAIEKIGRERLINYLTQD